MLSTTRKGKQLRRRSRYFEQLEQRQLLATLADPGFENPVQPANTFEQASGTGDGTLVGSAWTFSPSAGITRNISDFQNGALVAPEGQQFGLIQNIGSIQQNGSGFVVGKPYVLTISAALRNSGAYNDLRVLVDGATVFYGAITSLTFTDITTDQFTTTSATPVIRFETSNPAGGDRTVFIDNIRIGEPSEDLANPTPQNGSFELPDIATFQENNPATGWTGGAVVKPGVIPQAGPGVVNNGSDYSNPPAVTGTQAALLKSSAFMEQAISGFVVGNTYSIEYFVSPRTGNTNTLQVSIGGEVLQTVGVGGTAAYISRQTPTFEATAETMTLRFETLLTGDNSVFIDAVTIDEAPIAVLNGPFTVGFKQDITVTLDASGSADADGDAVSFAWDIDGDGQFDDATTSTVDLTLEDRETFGISALGTYPIAVRVTADGITTEATTTLTVSNVALDEEGNLNVFGTESGDRIVVTVGPKVRINGKLANLDGLDITGGTVFVYGYGGNDTITVSGSLDAVVDGGIGNDYIATGGGADTLIGGPGNDRLLGGTGDDTIYGGLEEEDSEVASGNDTASGGVGDDTIYGGDGADNLNGDLGNDIVNGEAGNDRLYGSSGDDIVRGGLGINQIDGGAGNDVLVGGAESDRIHGQGGNDVILGGDSLDYLYGGNGDDLIVADASPNDEDDDEALDMLLDTFLAEGSDGDYSAYFSEDTITSYTPDVIYGQGGNDVIFHSAEDRLLARTSGDVVTNVEPEEEEEEV